MRVMCATRNMSYDFAEVYPELGIIGTPDKVPSNLDLLILTGGSDINPIRYGSRPAGSVGWSDTRDKAEFDIADYVLRNTNAKILGVCRGMQLANVLMGGTLFQHLQPSHPYHHALENTTKSHPLSWLTYVNSLHHQGLRSIGDRLSPTILQYEPNTTIPETVSWGNRILGVQFHPEMFSSDLRKEFFAVVNLWVNGKASFTTGDSLKSWLTKIVKPSISVGMPIPSTIVWEEQSEAAGDLILDEAFLDDEDEYDEDDEESEEN